MNENIMLIEKLNDKFVCFRDLHLRAVTNKRHEIRFSFFKYGKNNLWIIHLIFVFEIMTLFETRR
jgi:hypothetical protein